MASYNKSQLEAAVKNSTSFRQTLMKLGLSPKGGNNATIKRLTAKWQIDISHFLGSAQKGVSKPSRTDIEEYLSNKKPCGSFRLKNRLLKEGFLEAICSSCNLKNWLDGKIPLELDHIDGNNENNVLTNLRLLCPNCHALTSTYRGKNQERAK
jgi:5-methylcytosine-specific restriction endonuclease McrA